MSTATFFRALVDRLAPCKSHEVELGDSAALAFGAQPAGRGSVGPVQLEKLFSFKCGKRLEHCESCPRFQAFRQRMALRDERLEKLQMVIGAHQVESDVRDRHLESTEVDHLDSDGPLPVGGDQPGHAHANSNTVIYPCSPRIEDAQARTECGHGDRGEVESITSHADSITAPQCGAEVSQ